MNPIIREINETNVSLDSIGIWWLGQEGYVIKTHDKIIYIDPYLSTYAERVTVGQPDEHVRMMQSPMNPEEVTNADLVICTHDHADHIDPEGIPHIANASPKCKFVVPECARQTILSFSISEDRINTLEGNDSLAASGIEIEAVPAKHEEFDKDEIKGYPYLSYIISIGELTFVHAGDTIPYTGQIDKFKSHKIDLAFVPINGRDKIRHDLGFEGNFNCKEAVDFARGIGAGLTIPMHYDMFTINTGSVEEFRQIAIEKDLRIFVMEHSTKTIFTKEIYR